MFLFTLPTLLDPALLFCPVLSGACRAARVAGAGVFIVAYDAVIERAFSVL